MGEKKFHYAWWIMISCCALYGAGIGMIGNTAGLYLRPVAQEMGWAQGSLNLYLTIVQIVMTFCLPFVGRLYGKVDVRALLLLGVTGMAVTYVWSAWFTSLTHWYIAGVSLGIWYSIILYLPGPLLINNWFRKHVGVALGTTVAFASVTAAFANPIGGMLIDEYGWRTARIILGCAAWLLAFPFVTFVVRYKPEDKGLKPFGYEETLDAGGAVQVIKKTGVPQRAAYRNPAFYLVFLLAGIIVFCASMHAQTPSYASSIGLSSKIGAFAVSVIMVGGITGKFVLGWLSDKIGATPTAVLAMGLGACGSALVILSGTALPMFYAGAFFFGFGYAALTVVPPLVVRTFFGQLNYEKIYSTVTMAFGFFGALAPLLFGLILDWTGSLKAGWVVVMCAYLLGAVVVILGNAASKKLEWISE